MAECNCSGKEGDTVLQDVEAGAEVGVNEMEAAKQGKGGRAGHQTHRSWGGGHWSDCGGGAHRRRGHQVA